MNPRAPLLELLDCDEIDAIVEKDGRLYIEFSNRISLSVTPTTAYEAWHFQFPRPGRPSGGSRDQFISVAGAHGRLI